MRGLQKAQPLERPLDGNAKGLPIFGHLCALAAAREAVAVGDVRWQEQAEAVQAQAVDDYTRSSAR